MAPVARWRPTTEEELLEALASGVIEEGHFLDLKREIPRGSSANRELARDLASFAIDGGLIVIGVNESDDGHHGASPVALDGLRERVDQVARSLCEPPISCSTSTIRSAADGSLGYLMVHVAPSPMAPHMVDGAYYGRSDTTKFRLSDADVLRLHERRRALEDAGRTMLRQAIENDPVQEGERKQAHLFIVAAPISAPDDLALSIVDGPGWAGRVQELLRHGYEPRELLGRSTFQPDWDSATRMSRRPDGVAASTSDLETDRTVRPGTSYQEDILEIQISEGGAVRLFLGRLSDAPQAHYVDEKPQPVLFDIAAVMMTRRVLSVVTALADSCGYLGPWSIGVAATGIAGLAAYERPNIMRFADRAQRYDAGTDAYEAVKTVNLSDITDHPGTVTGWLWGRFLRALDKPRTYDDSYLKDPELADDTTE